MRVWVEVDHQTKHRLVIMDELGINPIYSSHLELKCISVDTITNDKK